MKVDSQQNIAGAPNQSLSDTGTTASAKNFHEMSAGDVFKARVIDIQPNQVTIRLGSGNTLTAKSLVLPDARIGEESIFMVTENFKGQILLEMVKPQASILQNNIIKEALSNAGLFPNTANIELARALIAADMPINIQTLQKAAFFQYTGNPAHTAGIDHAVFQKVLFLLQENFPLQEKNVETLNGILNNTIRLKDNLTGMIDELFKTAGKDVQKELLTILLDTKEKYMLSRIIDNHKAEPPGFVEGKEKIPAANDKANITDLSVARELLQQLTETADDIPGRQEAVIERIKTALRSEFLIDLKQAHALEDVGQLYKTLHESAAKMLDAAQVIGVKGEFVNQLANLKDGIEFMNHINQYKEYMHIPFSSDGVENNGELFIFKDSRRGKKASEQASVLIALDCASLGRVETFINKNGRSLTMQFRSDQDSTLKLINRHAAELRAVLADKGFALSGLTVNKIANAFTVTDKQVNDKKEAPKRYTFDMRV